MFDTEKFIMLIESNPCLWDIASKDYMDKNVKNTCWRNVAESMYIGNWCELSDTQKDEYVKELRDKKWKNIKDNYKKNISEEKNVRSGSAAQKKKPYAFMAALSFLQNCSNKRKTTSSMQEDEIDVCNDDSLANYSCVDGNATECEPSTSSTLKQPSEHSKQSKKKKSNENNGSFQQELLQFLHRTENTDPDKIMLNSFLPYVKKLNNTQKLDFQLYVLQYFKNLEVNSNIQASSQTNHVITNPYNSFAQYYNPNAVTQSFYPSQNAPTDPNTPQLTFPQNNYDYLNYPHTQNHSPNDHE
ncbi:uncharacterized protein LOC107883988 [Acyrthosiphon pisum]|uniref:MADF domain-containing protein n=1 Tax=Acyrthosiphon pisum TaxID=7029 RepID=A0A8R2H561_ACYPI|nr:uncharacterized protein LOC107883988 [Acyrthosiphon pisum]|eukprot:XP_016660658.1 PREDICTED: uncharacterized protein LOC107883988 [Acyrthosiphon pisum]